MLTKEQWKQALDELSEVDFFAGHFSENENADFMDGIETVIEWMANKAEDDVVYDAFQNNRIKSVHS